MVVQWVNTIFLFITVLCKCLDVGHGCSIYVFAKLVAELVNVVDTYRSGYCILYNYYGATRELVNGISIVCIPNKVPVNDSTSKQGWLIRTKTHAL